MKQYPQITGSLSIILALVVTSCVSTESPAVNSANIDEEMVNSDANTLRLAHPYDPSDPTESCGLQAVSTSLEGSSLEVVTYPSSQLGAQQELIEQVEMGSLDLTIAGPSFLGAWGNDADIFDAPYLFRDAQHLERTFDGEIAEEIFLDLDRDTNMEFLSAWFYGTRHVTSNTEVNVSSDLSGNTMRVAESAIYQTIAEVLGASPTPMALGEVYLGLQQGTVDSIEVPPTTMAAQSLDEVQGYLNLTEHLFQNVIIVGNSDALASLTAEQRLALEAALEEGATAIRDCVDEQEEQIVEAWRDGDQITVNDDVDIEHFRKRSVEIISEHYDWVDTYLEIQESP